MQKLNFNINGKHYEATITEVEHNVAEVELNGKKYTIDVERSEAVSSAPRVVAPKAVAPAAAPANGETVTAPMPGTILAVNVQNGAAVKKGDVLMVLEAMKMENEIVAPADGTVASVNVTKGSSVETGTVLCVIG